MTTSKTGSTSSSSTSSTNSGRAPQNWDAQASFAEFAGFGRENFDAFVKASTIAAQGYGAIGQRWVDFTRASLEKGIEAGRAVATAKSVKDAVELQSDFARTVLDRYVTETTKLSELSAKTTTEALAPIQKRINEVVSKFNRAA